jgi:lactoylglutathione lyase
VLGRVPESEFGNLTMLELPGDEFMSLELVHTPGRGKVDPGGLYHLVIKVKSMDETLTDLGAEGIRGEPPGSPDGSGDFWTAWLTDPDGYRIDLVSCRQGTPTV